MPAVDVAASPLWLDISRLTLKPREQRYIINNRGAWSVNGGPAFRTSTEARVFMLSSPLHRIASRTTAAPAAVKVAWCRTLDGVQWHSELEAMAGMLNIGAQVQTIVRPYAIIAATGDPFGLRESVERLATEAYYMEPRRARWRLRAKAMAYVRSRPMTPFREAAEIGLTI